MVATKISKALADILLDRPEDCVAEVLAEVHGWDADAVGEADTRVRAALGRGELDPQDDYERAVLADMVEGSTWMAGAWDAMKDGEISRSAYRRRAKAMDDVGEVVGAAVGRTLKVPHC